MSCTVTWLQQNELRLTDTHSAHLMQQEFTPAVLSVLQSRLPHDVSSLSTVQLCTVYPNYPDSKGKEMHANREDLSLM